MLPLLLLLGACSHTPTPRAQPDWILGQSAEYPASRYLNGHGQADTLALARDRARADLAKIFSVQVSARSEDTTSYSQHTAGAAGPTTDSTLEIRRSIRTRTNEILRGVRIADSWQDPRTQAYHALAVLSRPRAAAALRTRIAELDAGTRAYLAEARAADDLFVKIASATEAVKAQVARRALQGDLQVVDRTGRGMPPHWNLGRLRADRGALLKRLGMTAKASGRNAAAVRNLLAGALAEAGFTVGDPADYVMTARLDYTTLPPRSGWYWITGTLQVTLAGIDEAHGVRRWPLKVSATDPGVAEQRLMQQVARYLQRDIQSTVLRIASGG